MTRLIYEDVIDRALRAEEISPGEQVSVFTKMGNSVSSGKVVASSRFGISVHGESVGFYGSDFYLFVPSQDDVVLEQIAKKPEVKKDDVKDQQADESPAVKASKDVKKDDAEDDGVVVVDALPDDLKDQLSKFKRIGGEDVKIVLAEIGDASVRVLREVGVDEKIVFFFVSLIQKAVADVLDKDFK